MTTKDELPALVMRAIGVHTKEELTQIRKGKAAIVGVGCDGCEVAEQLVRTGIGTITLIDPDVVEETNLNRQRLYSHSDIGIPKVYAAQRRLQEISPHTMIKAHQERIDYTHKELLEGHDVIVQGLDSMCARIITHELARELSIPIVTMSGQPPLRSMVSTALPGDPLYQELFSLPLKKPVKEMSEEEKKALDKQLTLERARHAVQQGANEEWLKELARGRTSWSITLGRSPVTGTLQTNEVIRLLTGKEPLARAPKIIVYDGNGLTEFGHPHDMCKVLEPARGKTWDYRLF